MTSQPREAKTGKRRFNTSPSTWSGTTTIAVVAGLTIAAFVFWLGFLLLIWLVMNWLFFPVSYWNMVQAFSSAFATAALIAGGFIAYRQLVDTANSRYIDVVNELFAELNSEENIRARAWIFRNLGFSDDDAEGYQIFKDLETRIFHGVELADASEILKFTLEKIEANNGEGEAYVKRTLNSLDRVAFLTQPGWIPDELIMPWMNPMVVKMWLRLVVYVEHERAQRGEEDYYKDAGKLGMKCVIWRINKYGAAVSRRSDSAV